MAEPLPDLFHSLDRALAGAVATIAPSVVHVARRHSGGSGIVWSPELVISASFHTPDRTRIGIGTDGSLELRDAEVIGRDPGTDLALLRVASGGLTPATFREVGELAVGNLVFAIGRPGRTVRASLRAVGVLGPEIRTPHHGRLDRYIESDRQIPRGFAGGPLIDGHGAVIGMNTRTLMRGADLAIPTATLRRVVAELEAHGGIRRGYLGIGSYPAQGGALIASLEEGSPAAHAGLLVGDLIVELDGVAIDGPDALRLALGDRAGRTVAIALQRGGVRQQVTATIGTRP